MLEYYDDINFPKHTKDFMVDITKKVIKLSCPWGMIEKLFLLTIFWKLSINLCHHIERIGYKYIKITTYCKFKVLKRC